MSVVSDGFGVGVHPTAFRSRDVSVEAHWSSPLPDSELASLLGSWLDVTATSSDTGLSVRLGSASNWVDYGVSRLGDVVERFSVASSGSVFSESTGYWLRFERESGTLVACGRRTGRGRVVESRGLDQFMSALLAARCDGGFMFVCGTVTPLRMLGYKLQGWENSGLLGYGCRTLLGSKAVAASSAEALDAAARVAEVEQGTDGGLLLSLRELRPKHSELEAMACLVDPFLPQRRGVSRTAFSYIHLFGTSHVQWVLDAAEQYLDDAIGGELDLAREVVNWYQQSDHWT